MLLLDAQSTTAPGSRSITTDRRLVDKRDGWSAVANVVGPTHSATRVSMNRALARLDEVGIVKVKIRSERPRFEDFVLLRDDGSGKRYTVPGEEKAIVLPPTFFWNGWHLVLGPAEIAMYLMLSDLATVVGPRKEGVGVVESVRQRYYGVSSEVYEAHRTLTEFGLTEMLDSVPGRRRGRIAPSSLEGSPDEPAQYDVLRFLTRPEGLDKPALEVVSSCLKDDPGWFVDPAVGGVESESPTA
jgi:hypothetical protein